MPDHLTMGQIEQKLTEDPHGAIGVFAQRVISLHRRVDAEEDAFLEALDENFFERYDFMLWRQGRALLFTCWR